MTTRLQYWEEALKYPDPLYVEVSPSKKHRFTLAYVVEPRPLQGILVHDHVTVIMQNPSTAGIRQPHDRTTKVLIDCLVQIGGFGVVSIVNLDPTIGGTLPFTTLRANSMWEENEEYVRREIGVADCVVCAWTTGSAQRRFARDFILPILREYHTPLAVFAENGMPYHPVPQRKNVNLSSELHHVTEIELSLV